MSKADVAAERKNQIVRATVECITKYGYHNFSMQDVARTAGVSKGIIHYYFLNKDELMMSVLSKVAGDIERVLAQDMAAIQSPHEKLGVFIDVCFDIVRSTKEYYQVNIDFWTQINQKEQVKSVISEHYKKFRKTAEAVIEQGQQSGEFRDVNAKEYAAYIIAIIDGISLQWLFSPEEFDYESITTSVKSLVLAGIKKA
jgi:TetR/AcrR family fatty acid metabolism transcriptional regulator